MSARHFSLDSRNGQINFSSDLTARQATALLGAAPRVTDFARSLMATQSAGRTMTSKQEGWLVYLAQQEADRLTAELTAPKTEPTAVSPSANRIDFAGIISLFDTAKTHLKRPRVRIATADGRVLVVKQTARGRFPGSLTVALDGAEFGAQGSFFGYVHPNGDTTVKDQQVLGILTELAADPVETAAKYGRSFNECSFCGRDLSNSEAGSSEIGYGPICAQHWGLPWNPNGKYTFGENQPVQIGALKVA